MKERLHILFIPHWYPSRVNATTGNFIQRHAEAVATLNQVSVVYVVSDNTLTVPFEISKKIIHGVTTIIVYFSPNENKLVHGLNKARAYILGLSKVSKFDIIHLNVLHYYGIIALYYSIVKKIPYVITEHWTRWNDNSISWKERIVAKMIAKKAMFLLPVCSHLGQNMKRIGVDTPQIVVPNVIDPIFFYAKDEKTQGKFIFLHISTLSDAQKNISGILRATRKLALKYDFFELHIGGDGDTTPIIEFSKKNHLEHIIKTFGQLTPKEVAHKMNTSHVFVLFSNKENQPCVINEAFACGLPVIATKIGGIPEFFPNEFGILIEKENENDLFEAMKICIAGKQFASPLKMANYAAEHFGKDVIANQFDNVYRCIYKQKV